MIQTPIVIGIAFSEFSQVPSGIVFVAMRSWVFIVFHEAMSCWHKILETRHAQLENRDATNGRPKSKLCVIFIMEIGLGAVYDLLKGRELQCPQIQPKNLIQDLILKDFEQGI